MPDITKIKIGNERERSYKDFPSNREFKKRAEDDNPGGGGSDYDEISGGNITEVDGKKYLTPLGGGIVYKPLNVEFTMTATEDGFITWSTEPIAEGGLIVGETYSVTVNGVTGNYVCYVDEYNQKIIGTFEDDMTVGDWQITSYHNVSFCNVFGNVGDEFSFSIVGKLEEVKIAESKYLPAPRMLYLSDENYYDEETGENYYFVKEYGTNKILTNNDIMHIDNYAPTLFVLYDSVITFHPYNVMYTVTRSIKDMYDPTSRKRTGALSYSEVTIKHFDSGDQEVLKEYAKVVISNSYIAFLTMDFNEDV